MPTLKFQVLRLKTPMKRPSAFYRRGRCQGILMPRHGISNLPGFTLFVKHQFWASMRASRGRYVSPWVNTPWSDPWGPDDLDACPAMPYNACGAIVVPDG